MLKHVVGFPSRSTNDSCRSWCEYSSEVQQMPLLWFGTKATCASEIDERTWTFVGKFILFLQNCFCGCWVLGWRHVIVPISNHRYFKFQHGFQQLVSTSGPRIFNWIAAKVGGIDEHSSLTYNHGCDYLSMPQSQINRGHLHCSETIFSAPLGLIPNLM